MDLLAHCAKQIEKIDSQQWLIGYSGGKDSSVLLDIFAKLKKSGVIKTPLFAIHVNHNISRNADDWAIYCQQCCKRYDLPIIVEKITSTCSSGQSLEAFARDQRYHKIKSHLIDGGYFVSGHHQRDQAETLLLQLMRGAGLDGLKGMPTQKKLGNGNYLRPLLHIPFKQIDEYAARQNIQYIEDESNTNIALSRNYIRHQVLPVLEKQFPSAQKKIAQSAEWLKEIPADVAPDRLVISDLLLLSMTEIKQQIRTYFRAKTGQPIHFSALRYICEHHLHARQDRQPQVEVGAFIVRRFKDEIYITKQLPENELYCDLTPFLEIGEALEINEAKLYWEKGEGLLNTNQKLEVKPLHFDQVVEIHHRYRRCTIKKLFNEMAIPYWLRKHYFGLYQGQSLVAIPSVGIVRDFYQKHEKAYMPLWQIDEKFVKI